MGQVVYPIVGGVWQTPDPVRVTDVTRHTDGELYYAVEDTTTRYPAHQLERVDPDDPIDEDRGDGAALDPETAWPVLDALLDAAEEMGADWLVSPWREARAAGEVAVHARSVDALEEALGQLRALVEAGEKNPGRRAGTED